MTDPIRALCAELVHIADALNGGTPLISNQGQALDGYSALAAFRSVADRARVALAEQVTEPPAVAELPSDEDLLRIAATEIEPYDRIEIGEYEAGNNCALEVYGSELIAFARAVLARWGQPPAPPADGEVTELVAWLRETGQLLSRRPDIQCRVELRLFTRAAELLERHATPAPEPAPAADRPLWKVMRGAYASVRPLSADGGYAAEIDAVADWLMADHPAHATAASRLRAEARRAREGQ